MDIILKCAWIIIWLLSSYFSAIYVINFYENKRRKVVLISNKFRYPDNEEPKGLTLVQDGREFDKHFLSVMKKSKGKHKLNDRDRKVMSMLYEQDRYERMREEIERRHYH